MKIIINRIKNRVKKWFRRRKQYEVLILSIVLVLLFCVFIIWLHTLASFLTKSTSYIYIDTPCCRTNSSQDLLVEFKNEAMKLCLTRIREIYVKTMPCIDNSEYNKTSQVWIYHINHNEIRSLGIGGMDYKCLSDANIGNSVSMKNCNNSTNTKWITKQNLNDSNDRISYIQNKGSEQFLTLTADGLVYTSRYGWGEEPEQKWNFITLGIR